MADSVTDFYDRLSPEYRDNMGWDWESTVRSEGATLHRFLESEMGRKGLLHIARLHLRNRHPGYRPGTAGPRGACVRPEPGIGRAGPSGKPRVSASRVNFSVADFRDLGATISDAFDVVISCDNAIAHCLDDDDLGAALSSIRTRLNPGGLLLLSLRDYDTLLADKRRFNNEHVHDTPDGRRIAFQVWDWAGDERSYRNHQFLIGEMDGAYELKHFETELRILRRHEILAAVEDTGYAQVRWHPPEASGYYQPIVTGTQVDE